MGGHGEAGERSERGHLTAADRLTTRERDIVGRLGRGEFDEEIAAALQLSVHTVRTHVRNAMMWHMPPEAKEAVEKAHRAAKKANP